MFNEIRQVIEFLWVLATPVLGAQADGVLVAVGIGLAVLFIAAITVVVATLVVVGALPAPRGGARRRANWRVWASARREPSAPRRAAPCARRCSRLSRPRDRTCFRARGPALRIHACIKTSESTVPDHTHFIDTSDEQPSSSSEAEDSEAPTTRRRIAARVRGAISAVNFRLFAASAVIYVVAGSFVGR